MNINFSFLYNNVLIPIADRFLIGRVQTRNVLSSDARGEHRGDNAFGYER